MQTKELKFVKGSLEQGKPATICFFSEVEKWNVNDFIWELNYIKDYVRPSEIKILINSVGGSCVDGISAFSSILNCDIPTTCIIEGIAASMASVIWAAGDTCLMRDYALLMIHNPWADCSDDPETQRMIENFTSQLKTIYMKRFNMDEEKVTNIMNGEDNFDGTFFTAEQAVEAGFISNEQVIVTSGIKSTIAAKLDGITNPGDIASIMQATISETLSKVQSKSITDKDEPIINNNKKEKMKEEFVVVASLLGFKEDASVSAVSAKVQELINANAELDTLKAANKGLEDQVTALNTELTGCKASVENLTKNLEDVNAALDAYKQKEAEEKTASINAMVDEACQAGKISKESKETWVSMAEANFELAKNTLASIPARVDISAQIANDPENKDKANTPEDEAKIQAQVAAIVGKDFKFHTTEEL